eukprot:TRINITY_DN2911_c0_g1_i1.p1 TRINITY_DN2911_c0_g1~~TRINITY_DN2911_c0_g1_i1.p1  ORF type:complete len:326 (+),score=56.86 TRINITY_DN2911_c0_g1_i1:58-978(+)
MISDLLTKKQPGDLSVSFEYFPPKTQQGVENLYKRIEKMAKAKPVFVDFTWGAGGGTSDLTLELSSVTQNKYHQVANMHLTCTNMPREKVDVALAGAKAAGIKNIVALRGDPPRDQAEWKAIDTGFACALDLVKYIKEKHGDDFHLAVAGYPEGHPDTIGPDGLCPAETYAKEIDYLKQKVDAGGNIIITQLFYDTDRFLKFAEDCKKAGITVPIIPGLLPIQSYAGLQRMVGFCKTYIPPEVLARLEEVKDDEEKTRAFGVELCVEMCKKLIAHGFTHLHFYCLNLEHSTFAVMEKLGIPTHQEA